MSTLPDITTSGVGYIAYWNAINDGGVGSITASDALTDGNIQSYTLYDNGFTAQYTTPNVGRTITVRVKQDGWFVAYMDRTNQFVQNASTKPNGYYDLVDNWTDNSNEVNAFPINSLERSINSLQSNLSNSGSITYNSSDVGLYNYQYSSATTSTMFGTHRSTTVNFTSGLIYTSGTTVLYAAATGKGNNNIKFEGTVIQSNGNPSSLDILSSGLIPNSQTEYNMTSNTYGNIIGSVLTIWS